MNPTQKQLNPGALADLTPADILRCAARYLEIHGWMQGVYYGFTDSTPFPPACVTGAIGMAAHGKRVETPTNCGGPGAREFRLAFHCLITYLIDQGVIVPDGDDWSTEPATPFDWNDRDDQTAAQVITTLHSAADDYDWTHATEDQLETYADACVWVEKHPTREGFLAWLGAR